MQTSMHEYILASARCPGTHMAAFGHSKRGGEKQRGQEEEEAQKGAVNAVYLG